jgi:hypothetical protein
MVEIAKQGDLDGLCGVYSVFNAVALLWPDEMADPLNRAGLFAELMAYAKNQGIDAVEGTVSSDVLGLLAVASAAISRQFPGSLSVRRPWLRKRAGTAAEWLGELAGALPPDGSSVAILGLWKPEHWTVIRSICVPHDRTVEPTVRLADSSGIPDELPFSAFGMYRAKAEYILGPKYTFILTRA